MIKLYKFTDTEKTYWETWDNDDGTHTVHWGKLGTKGSVKNVSEDMMSELLQEKRLDGYIEVEDEVAVLIEYAVDNMGSAADLEKRHQLQERMDETLGWTGLGSCDGGSIGSGTMEVCNFVVDGELAIEVIREDLQGTEFADYTRVFIE